MLWTVSESILKEGAVTGRTQSRDTYRSLLVRLINTALKPYKKYVVEPDKQEFASQIVQAHRKGDVAYHVKAFRGSKDGFLFFLPTGIVWGFKKPLEFFSFESIDSVSYTSVLQRTFNLSVAASASLDAGPQEFEFSMIDQVDFAGIDAYVKRHGLQDASMAEQRQAKKLNVNRVKGEEAEPEDSNHEGELEKAAKEADDLKDDEEEDDDFDPGSEGESEGEGSSSEEDEQGHRSEKGLDNQELDSGDENSEA